jgi:hypothetical protein
MFYITLSGEESPPKACCAAVTKQVLQQVIYTGMNDSVWRFKSAINGLTDSKNRTIIKL